MRYASFAPALFSDCRDGAAPRSSPRQEALRTEQPTAPPPLLVCPHEYVAHNKKNQRNLHIFPGCYDLHLDPADAALSAAHLTENWVSQRRGTLPLGDEAVARGFDTYKETYRQPAKPAQQRRDTLLFTARLLPLVRRYVPGFVGIENGIIRELALPYDNERNRLKLRYVHALHQSPASEHGALFGWHRDDVVVEEVPDDILDDDTPPRLITHTVIVKLTSDKSGASPSQMMIGGATAPFSYGAAAGSGCWFQSRLWHTSLPHANSCLKFAFFYTTEPKPTEKRKRLRQCSGNP